ncbi:DUF1330 domain-containing protein [Aquimarina sediminis]|uniref:DUF1330 domain-containing protein n=1 Tax=Aquimarina sediminis TaxID=2070536 RepID=UPI000CA07D9B|nr:DUF1330 domain-containing protein [Aquimarina sediminis]
MKKKTTVIIVAKIRPDGKLELNHYLSEMNKHYEKNNVTLLNKFSIDEMIVGEERPDIIAIMEFPDNSFNKIFKSKEYNLLLPYREKAFEKLEIFISKENK